MYQRALDNDRMMRALRMLASFMQEFLEVIQRVIHLGNRRWNERRIRKIGSSRADPILRDTKFARRLSIPPDTAREFSVDFPDEPKTKR